MNNSKSQINNHYQIQSRLFDLGAAIATPPHTSELVSMLHLMYRSKKVEKTKFPEDNITVLEKWIDEYDSKLPPFTTFTIPVRMSIMYIKHFYHLSFIIYFLFTLFHHSHPTVFRGRRCCLADVSFYLPQSRTQCGPSCRT